MPWYVTTFFRLISPFIDPVTKEKMKFNEPLVRYVPPAQLKKEFGGDADFQYNHEIYWPALCQLAEKRRRDYVARWEKAGKHIGEHEAFLRGGEAKSLSGEFVGTDFPEGFVDKPVEASDEKVEEKPVETDEKVEEQPAEAKAETAEQSAEQPAEPSA